MDTHARFLRQNLYAKKSDFWQIEDISVWLQNIGAQKM